MLHPLTASPNDNERCSNLGKSRQPHPSPAAIGYIKLSINWNDLFALTRNDPVVSYTADAVAFLP